MKKNETNPTEVMKFFREQREARQLQAMNYGGVNDPTKKVNPKVGPNGEILAGPGVSTDAVGKVAGSQNQQVTNYARPKPESFGARQARLSGKLR
jgi:hypothetical protein